MATIPGSQRLLNLTGSTVATTATIQAGTLLIGSGVTAGGKVTNVTAGTANTDAVNVLQLNNATTGVLVYQGTWNASTNSPSLASGTGTPGYYYIVSTDGSTNLDGITDWKVGDWAVFSDQATDAWQKIDNSQVGNVTGSGVNNRLAIWNGTSAIDSDSRFFTSGTRLIGEQLAAGDGTDGYFYSDSAGRTAFTGGDFYIQSGVTNSYNYATNQYIGNSSGDNIYFRGNALSGNDWSIGTGGNATFTSSVTPLTLNRTGGATALIALNISGTNRGFIGATSTKCFEVYNTSAASKFSILNGGDATFTGNATFAGKIITTEVESASTLLLDAASDITIDAGGGDIILSDDATIFGTISSSGGMQIRSRVNNVDMFLRGVDNGTEFNALTLDMSDAGTGTFNNHIITGGNATFNGGNISLNGAYPRINMYSTDAGEDDWSVINNNGIFGIYNATVASFGLTIAETTNAVSISSGSLILGGTGRIQGIDTVTATTDATNKDYVDTVVAGVPQGTVTKSGTPVNNQLAVWTSATNIEGESELTYDGSTFTVGGTGNTTTFLDVIGTNTAGAPATAAAIRIYGYEGRGEGIFYYDSDYSGKEWYSGLPYSGGDTFQIGYDASGNQAQYTNNGVLRIFNTGQIQFNNYGQSAFSGTVTTFPAFTGDGKIVDRTPAQVLSDIGGVGVTSVATTNGITGGTITSSGTIQVDSTVVRTTGNQSIAGTKTFTGVSVFSNSAGLQTSRIDCQTGQQLVLNAGESSSYATGQTAENVYVNAEAGLQVNSSPDNWNSGWAGRNAAYINRADATSFLPGVLTIVTGITITGTGRIQGIDTVTASTDAANKAYVDSAVSGGSGVTSVATGNGISGGTITSTGTLTVGAGDGLDQSSTGLLVDSTVVRTTGQQFISGNKVFTSDTDLRGEVRLGGTALSPQDVVFITMGVSSTENTALMMDGNGIMTSRNLGSNAFNSTSYLPLTGGTVTGNIQTTDTTGSSGVLRIRSTITGTPSYGYPNVGAGDVVIEGGGTTQRQPGVITLINDDSSISANQNLGVIQFVGKDDATNGYASSQIIGMSNTGAGTGNSGGGILRFLTSNGSTLSERMRIEHDGRVGIGVTSPGATLDVSGSFRLQSGGSAYLSISSYSGSPWINTGTSGGTVQFGAPTSNTTNIQVQGTVKATGGYKSSDGSAGITGTFTFVDKASATRSLTIKNGLITAKT